MGSQPRNDGIDDGSAYAAASWARFNGEVSDDLLRAVCAAFALVSAADGSVSASEIDRFANVLAESARAFPKLDLDKVDGPFRQLCQALLSDPEPGRRQVLAEVASINDDRLKAALVYEAARIAMEADGRTLASEEAALAEIGEALGLPRGHTRQHTAR